MAAPIKRLSTVTQNYLRISHKVVLSVPKRWTAITGNEKVDKTLNTVTDGKIGTWLQWYEDVVGLTEVREAQDKVIQAERSFNEAQISRREQQKAATNIKDKLKVIHAQLDKVQRGDEKYLALLTEEYEILKQEKWLETEINHLEELERSRFSTLSSAVRESHEKERARTERTKYWSIIGSMIGACIGIFGASLNNYLRNRELKRIVRESATDSADLRTVVAQLADTTQEQHNHIQSFVGDLQSLINAPGTGDKLSPIKETFSADSTNAQLELKTKEIIDVIHRQDETLSREMEGIKRLLAGTQVMDKEGTIVYVGPELEDMLQNTENNIEWKIKSNALWTVTFIYGAFAITLPILYKIFKGD